MAYKLINAQVGSLLKEGFGLKRGETVILRVSEDAANIERDALIRAVNSSEARTGVHFVLLFGDDIQVVSPQREAV